MQTAREIVVLAGAFVAGVGAGQWRATWSTLSRVFGLTHEQLDRRQYEWGHGDGWDEGYHRGFRDGAKSKAVGRAVTAGRVFDQDA